MATVELTTENFATTIESNDIIIVDFWAEWCGPCRTFGPIFEEASDKHPNIVFGKVDTAAQEEIAAHFKIQAIPTLIVFRERVVLYNEAGMVPGEALEDLIGQIEALDMAEIHQQIAQEVAGESMSETPEA